MPREAQLSTRVTSAVLRSGASDKKMVSQHGWTDQQALSTRIGARQRTLCYGQASDSAMRLRMPRWRLARRC
jgi:hypothetical protein